MGLFILLPCPVVFIINLTTSAPFPMLSKCGAYLVSEFFFNIDFAKLTTITEIYAKPVEYAIKKLSFFLFEK